ncbi:MAG: hypothetical protein IPP72_17955 [Chitinophagaceae bacterium]|nr:hypothetical protein [Chitinophagaceae bacterium]
MSNYKAIGAIAALSVFYSMVAVGQNVGIGTTTPGATLEIKKPSLNELKISSASYNDTSRIILSNRLNNSAGTDMLITSLQEKGLRISSKSDLNENNNDSILSITPQGKVGINTKAPGESLDVSGNINYTQNLKVGGNAGAAGQVLGVNSAGKNEWVDIGDYKYSRMVTSTTSTTITVPAGVSRMTVEQWGAGGGGGSAGGGGSGCYSRYTFDVSLIQSFTIVNGTGGAAQTSSSEAVNGTNGSVSINLTSGGVINYLTNGGISAKYGKVGQPNVPINYTTGSILVGYLGMPGKRGQIVRYDNNYQFGGDGGDAVMGIADGGSGSQFYFDGNPSLTSVYSTNGAGVYSSGGGGGANNLPITVYGAAGGNGVTVLRW